MNDVLTFGRNVLSSVDIQKPGVPNLILFRNETYPECIYTNFFVYVASQSELYSEKIDKAHAFLRNPSN